MSDLHPWTRAARTIGRMGAQSCRRVFHKESRYAGGSGSREFEVRDDGRRSESFDCIALTGDAEGGPRHEGFTLAPRKARQLPLELEFGEAVPSDAKERQRWDCIFVIGSSSRSRRGGSASTRQLEPLAARQVHQSWRKRIAAPRLENGFDQRELHRVPSAPPHFL